MAKRAMMYEFSSSFTSKQAEFIIIVQWTISLLDKFLNQEYSLAQVERAS